MWVFAFSEGVQALDLHNRGLNMSFVQNVGQLSDDVVFYSMHPSVVYVLRDGIIHINGVRVSFGSKPRFITGDMPLRTKISYFGQNKAISNVPTYRRVVLKEVYPKIDAILTADGRGVVEFQFIVHPGGDLNRIRLETDGRVVQRKDGIYIARENRELVRISDLKAYQGAEEVEVRVQVKGGEVKFIVDDWDRKHTLVIDPVATAILTSSDGDYALALTGYGNYVYVAGSTYSSSNFAPNRVVFGTSGNQDVFVSRLSDDLTTHLSTAILSSSGRDYAHDIAVNGDFVYIAGYTESSGDFAPNRNVFGASDGYDAFVSRLSADLSGHIATAIIASTDWDQAHAIAISPDAEFVYVGGYTENSSNFAPSRNVFGTGGGKDAFITKLDSSLSNHVATAILTSDGNDYVYALSATGNYVYAAGGTWNSSNFAPNRTVFGTPGSFDGFITKLNYDLSYHVGTAVLASSGDDFIQGMDLDGGYVYVAGYTRNSSDLAPSRNVFGTPGGYRDAFVSKFDTNLTTHMATAVLSSSDWDEARAVDVGSGSVYVGGFTKNYSDFAPDRGVLGTPSSGGYYDAFVSRLNGDLSAHMATAILTSDNDDHAWDMVFHNGEVYTAGHTENPSNFSLNRTVFGTPGGMADAFVAKLPDVLSVQEKAVSFESFDVSFVKGVLKVNLPTSAYVGFDVYSTDGRLIKRVGLGYLPAGHYEHPLKLPKGVYLIKVRVAKAVKEVKVVM